MIDWSFKRKRSWRFGIGLGIDGKVYFFGVEEGLVRLWVLGSVF